MNLKTHLCAFSFLLLTITAYAEIIVYDPVPITHNVIVNRIRTLSTGGQVATVFGNAGQEADIIDKVNQIWAQVGVEIIFQDVQDYTSDFAYDNDGQDSSVTRSTADLSTMLNLSDAPTGGSSTDIDMFFVNIVPGFSYTTLNTANGLARVDRPGTAVFVGSNLLSFSNGRDAIASVMAHEIGHNLGLFHTDSGLSNLMSPSGDTDYIEASQVLTIFTDGSATDGFDLLIPVAEVTTNYESWATDNNVLEDPEGDDDRDGLSNLLEFALGKDPSISDPSLPQPTLVNNTSLQWTISKQEEAVQDSLNYEIYVSNDLSTWQLVGSTGSNSSIVTDDNNEITASLELQERGFFQLRVSIP
ncbi:MAG: zinc-dependent metalloprotease family protein [Akkermansiaceae bacterium]